MSTSAEITAMPVAHPDRLRGLLLIVRPFGASLIPVTLGLVAAATFYAVAAILTRARCAQVPPAMQAFWLNIALLVCGLLGLLITSAGVIWTEIEFPFLLAPLAGDAAGGLG